MITAPPLELSAAAPATYATAPVSVPAASVETTPEPQVGIALHEFQSLSDGAAGSGHRLSGKTLIFVIDLLVVR